MSKVCITLVNDNNEYKDIIFDVFDTNIAGKWLDEIAKEYPINEDWRFTGWPNGKTADYYISELNKCIDIINDYEEGTIILRGDADLNHLHKYFEVLRGGILTPNPWFEQSPLQVKNAVCDFNVLIHNYEKLLQSNHLSPTITCTFKGQRFPLNEEDYQFFTYKWKFGTIYINYCEVGKHLLELYGDNDSVVGDDNIRPLEYYSADFKLKFFTDCTDEEFEQYNSGLQLWLKENKEAFSRFKHLSLGFIPVALLNYRDSGLEGLTQRKVIDELSVYSRVGSVKVFV